LSESDDASPDSNLTGYWSGEYWYDAGAGTLAQFAAHINDAGAAFDGTTLETAKFWSRSIELTASISGERTGAAVEFIKRYDPGQRVHRNPIFYAGALNADFTQIDGIWATEDHGHLTGGFRMLRGGKGPKAAVKREAKEPALAEAENKWRQVPIETHKPKRKSRFSPE
jgi:hypothetical protein